MSFHLNLYGIIIFFSQNHSQNFLLKTMNGQIPTPQSHDAQSLLQYDPAYNPLLLRQQHQQQLPSSFCSFHCGAAEEAVEHRQSVACHPGHMLCFGRDSMPAVDSDQEEGLGGKVQGLAVGTLLMAAVGRDGAVLDNLAVVGH